MLDIQKPSSSFFSFFSFFFFFFSEFDSNLMWHNFTKSIVLKNVVQFYRIVTLHIETKILKKLLKCLILLLRTRGIIANAMYVDRKAGHQGYNDNVQCFLF
jgi:hypothetical protein